MRYFTIMETQIGEFTKHKKLYKLLNGHNHEVISHPSSQVKTFHLVAIGNKDIAEVNDVFFYLYSTLLFL